MLKTIKKMKARFMAMVLVAAAMVSISPAAASHAEEHINWRKQKETGEIAYCNNTYRAYIHTGFSHSIHAYEHILVDGRVCEASRLIYLHRVECTSCYYVFLYNAAGECEEAHNKCGTNIKEEPHIGASQNH